MGLQEVAKLYKSNMHLRVYTSAAPEDLKRSSRVRVAEFH